MILDHLHPISNRISMTKHIRSHMLDTPIISSADTDCNVPPDNLYHESHHTLQYSSNTHHDKPSKEFFIIHRMKNSKESHLLKPGNFLSIIRLQHKQGQPVNWRTTSVCAPHSHSYYTNLFLLSVWTELPIELINLHFLNELSSVEIKEDISL